MTKRIIIPVVTLGVAALLLFAINGCWNSWEGRAGDQKTDDAYVRADMTPLSTRISGTVRSMDVNDYQPVTQGQLLVQLDDEDYRAKLAEAKAALAGAQAELADNQAAKSIQDAKIQNAETGIAQATAAVSAAKAAITAVQPAGRAGRTRTQAPAGSDRCTSNDSSNVGADRRHCSPTFRNACRSAGQFDQRRSRACQQPRYARSREAGAHRSRYQRQPLQGGYPGQTGGHHSRRSEPGLYPHPRAYGRRSGRTPRTRGSVGFARTGGH